MMHRQMVIINNAVIRDSVHRNITMHHIIMVLVMDIMDIDLTDNHNNNVDIIIDIIIVINADTVNNNSVDIIISAIIKNLATRKQALVRIWIMRDCVAMK